MSTEAYSNRGSPVRGDSSEWGPQIWKKLDLVLEEIPCESCKIDGKVLLDALHDLINVKLNKRVHSPNDFVRVADFYTEAAKVVRAYAESVRCPKAR